MPSLSDLQRVPLQDMPEGWGRLGDLADAGNARGVYSKKPDPSWWDDLMQRLFGGNATQQPSPGATPRPSGNPGLYRFDGDSTKQFMQNNPLTK